jgi:hypothetical protein
MILEMKIKLEVRHENILQKKSSWKSTKDSILSM